MKNEKKFDNNSEINRPSKDKKRNNIVIITILEIISFIILSIAILIAYNSAQYYFTQAPGFFDLFYIFATLPVIAIPGFIGITTYTCSVILLSKYKSTKRSVPKFNYCLNFVNIIQIILIPCLFFSSLVMKSYKSNDVIKDILYSLHGDKYEIVRIYDNHSINEKDYRTVFYKLDDFPYLITGLYDWADGDYYDDYDETKAAEVLNYREYIKNLFDNNTVSKAKIEEDVLKISMILSSSYLENTDITKAKIKQLIDYYSLSGFKNKIAVGLSFINNIEDKKEEDYIKYLSMFDNYNNATCKEIQANMEAYVPVSYVDEDISLDKCIDGAFEIYLNYER